MIAAQKCSPFRPLDVPEERWSEAVRREDQIRTLAARAPMGRAAVIAAGHALGLSAAQVYRLVARFRVTSLTQALVCPKPGPAKGTRRLPAAVELCIEDAIKTLFTKREAPSMDALRRMIDHNCWIAGLKPPSRTAIQARVSTRSLKELVKAREGAEAARQRFRPVQPGLRPQRPLAIVQIDHAKVDIQLVDELTHPPAQRILETLQQALDQPPGDRMENILLLAESGMGKTMLLRKFQRAHRKAFDPTEGLRPCPVVLALMPEEPSEEAFFLQVLKAVEAPFDLARRRHRLGIRETTFRPCGQRTPATAVPAAAPVPLE